MVYVHSLNEKMGFGKYSALTLKEVIDCDPSYIDWCLKNVSRFAMDGNASSYYRGDKKVAYWTEDEDTSYHYEEEYENFFDSPYYNDQLDMDQQSIEFWDDL